MSFDGITTSAIVNELSQTLINSRIEKIYVPNKNEIIFSFHTQDRKNHKLLISIDANNSRLHLTTQSRENPAVAPQFCMILRKYLQSGKIVDVKQIGLDRIIVFTIENINDFGDFVRKQFIIELMGKYSNAILIDENKKILDSIRHVTNIMSSVREVLPGKAYQEPSTLGKINFFEITSKQFIELLNTDSNLTNTLMEKFIGFSKTFATYLCNTANISLEISSKDIPSEKKLEIYNLILDISMHIKSNEISFKTTENQKDYYILPRTSKNEATALSSFLDEFYATKEKSSILKNAKNNLEREINTNLSKLKKKLAQVEDILKDEPNLEKFRQYGELISANIYKMQLGMDKLITENFYNNCELIEIPLQVNLSPSRNAQNYFKKYTKLKNSILHANEHKASYEKDISYLESVLYNISEATNLNELDDIKDELITASIIKKPGKRFKRRESSSEPIKYEKDGIEILVGRNNIQNDKLTFKIAKKTDTWLHTKNIHGSHVIIRNSIVSDEILYYAAQLAVKHSQAKNSKKVEVDYTLAKYVHKESGSKPGMVVYTDYKTIIV